MANFTTEKFFNPLLCFLLLLSLGCNAWLSEKPNFAAQAATFTEHILQERLKTELRLSARQQRDFDRIEIKFVQNKQQIGNRIKSYQLRVSSISVCDTPDLTTIADLSRNIADEYYQLEWLQYRQMLELKNICSKRQQAILQRYLENQVTLPDGLR